VESIRSQSFQDYEMILVNDGSTDHSADICNELARQDGRITVIHQPNNGLSHARNSGIELAKGEYITFVDSDDRIAPHTYLPLMELLAEHPEYDMLEYPVMERHGNKAKQRLRQFGCREYRDMQLYWLECKAYEHAYAWNKIYRRQLFAGTAFPYGRAFEDVFTLPKLLAKCKVVATTNKGLYLYCWNTQGITANAKGKELNDLLTAHMEVWNTLYKNGNSLIKRDLQEYYKHLLNIQLDVFELTGQRPVLPHARYWGSWKLCLLQWIGMNKICKWNKIIHKLTR